jgi:methylenetetrahydrofolate reductase (NADPH)
MQDVAVGGTPAGRRKLPVADLKRAVVEFLDEYSIEATPHSLSELDAYPDFLSRGKTVYVAHPPRASFESVVDMAIRLQGMGYRTVPHLAVRRIESRAQLETALDQLRMSGIDTALVISGDLSRPVGPYYNTMQLLESELLPAHGFRSVGVAGHPEGSRTVGPTALRKALQDKAQFAATTDLDIYVVTQFGFNATAVTNWVAAARESGVALPIHIGMAGIVPFKELLRYAMRCGVSASMRMLVARSSALHDTVKLAPVSELVLSFARYRLSNPDCGLDRAHFFAFGGAERTARWINAVLAGQFEIDSKQRTIELD